MCIRDRYNEVRERFKEVIAFALARPLACCCAMTHWVDVWKQYSEFVRKKELDPRVQNYAGGVRRTSVADIDERESLSLSAEHTSLLCEAMLSLLDYDNMDVLTVNGFIREINSPYHSSVFLDVLAVEPGGAYRLIAMNVRKLFGESYVCPCEHFESDSETGCESDLGDFTDVHPVVYSGATLDQLISVFKMSAAYEFYLCRMEELSLIHISEPTRPY